jgi:hypothetical protein
LHSNGDAQTSVGEAGELPIVDLADRIQTYKNQVNLHSAGSFSKSLDRIEWYLGTYVRDKRLCTVETGCGASTIPLAHCAMRHTAYCYDNRASTDSSVTFALSYLKPAGILIIDDIHIPTVHNLKGDLGRTARCGFDEPARGAWTERQVLAQHCALVRGCRRLDRRSSTQS